MSYERSGGKQCVGVGCTTSQKKIHCWGQEICEDHDIKHADCPCLVPYKLLCLPKDDQKRRCNGGCKLLKSAFKGNNYVVTILWNRLY
jgi:hypothetical protein